jgi:hypothetical protein
MDNHWDNQWVYIAPLIELDGYAIAKIMKNAGLVLDIDDPDPNELARRIVQVLNRELPGGKLRKHKKVVK